MWIAGKSDVKDAIVKHIEEIDRELQARIDGNVRAELFKAKSQALKALLEVYK